jgi:hypothetical protein
MLVTLMLASCSDDASNVDDTPLCERDGYVRELTPDAAQLVDDELVISVSHGGCPPYRYGVCYPDSWVDTTPAEIAITVLHDSSGNCDPLVHKDLRLGLAPLRDDYFGAHPGPSGRIDFILDGTSISYEFNRDEM